MHVPLMVIFQSEGVHFRLAIKGKCIEIYLFPNIYTYISEYYLQKSWLYFMQLKQINFET